MRDGKDDHDDPADAGYDADADRRFASGSSDGIHASFRAVLGDDLVHALVDLMRDRRRRGMPKRVARRRACVDMIRNAPGAWLEAARELHTRRRGDQPKRTRTMMDTLRQDVAVRRSGMAAAPWLRPGGDRDARARHRRQHRDVQHRQRRAAAAAAVTRTRDRLVTLWGAKRHAAAGADLVSRVRRVARRAQSRSSAIGLWLTQSVNLTGGDEPQRLIGTFVSGIVFRRRSALKAERGAAFHRGRQRAGAGEPVVVITPAVLAAAFRGDAIGDRIDADMNGTAADDGRRSSRRRSTSDGPGRRLVHRLRRCSSRRPVSDRRRRWRRPGPRCWRSHG